MTVNEAIVNFVKDILGAIREGFKGVTVYHNSKGRRILSIGKIQIPLLSENEMRIALSLVVILVSTLAGDSVISEFKELEIIFYNIFISSFINNKSN